MTIHKRVNPQNPDPETVALAAQVLESGGLIVYPTDTVYGLGCNPYDTSAVERLFTVKRRPTTSAVPVAVSGTSMASKLALVTYKARILMQRFWPGPLTIVLSKKAVIPPLVTGGEESIGIRMPNHTVPLRMMEVAGLPIVATSANLHGKPSPSVLDALSVEISSEVNLILDGGRTTGGVESTVLDLTVDPPKILRRGPISDEVLLGAI